MAQARAARGAARLGARASNAEEAVMSPRRASPAPAREPARLERPPALRASLLFHLNLCYSAIEAEDRARVVEACYEPLLGLCERLPWLSLAVEAPLHTLELAAELAPAWLARLRALVASGRVELVGSGDTQLAGPLVPASVNRWNQALGRQGYEALLGARPRTALVGELAFSQGLVDAYLDAGYETLVAEWNNARRAHPRWRDGWRYESAWTRSALGRRMRVAWVDSVLFQKLQRCLSGELPRAEYKAWVHAQRGEAPRHVFLYAGDAEVLGFRPGRYAAEPPLVADEWRLLEELLRELCDEGVSFATPGETLALEAFAPRRTLRLSCAADPVPVKKQPKYNVTRWGLSGRDDLGLNARCHARTRALEAGGGTPEEWRALCRAWSSDLRTHITERRWSALGPDPLAGWESAPRAAAPGDAGEPLSAEIEDDGRFLRIATPGVALVLDRRRGLAIESLAFPALAPEPLVGTLRQGFFDDIDWAADFYSGHTVLEVPAARRVTDLERCEPRVTREAECVAVEALVPSALGPLAKRVRVSEHKVVLEVGLSAWGRRPRATLRAAFVTLAPQGWRRHPRLFVRAASGGAPERMPLAGDFDHGAAVSALVSARTAFGATDGRLALDDGELELRLAFAPERAPALPLLTHRTIAGRRFCRVAFSMGEIDETLVPGAPLRDFALELSAGRLGEGWA